MSQKSVKFHIKSNDYFGTIATVLSLVEQSLYKKDFKKINIKILNKVEKDLVYLQNYYKIIKK